MSQINTEGLEKLQTKLAAVIALLKDDNKIDKALGKLSREERDLAIFAIRNEMESLDHYLEGLARQISVSTRLPEAEALTQRGVILAHEF